MFGRVQNIIMASSILCLFNHHKETDIAAAALKMTAEREEVIDFIAPYYEQTGISIGKFRFCLKHSQTATDNRISSVIVAPFYSAIFNWRKIFYLFQLGTFCYQVD